MDEQSTKNIISVVLFLVVIGSCIASYFILSKTPLGKALNDVLGTVGAFAHIVEQQLEICQKNGYFNTGKGCYLGALLLPIGILYTAFQFLSLFVGYKSKAVRTAADVSGKPAKEIVKDALDNIDDEKIEDDDKLTKEQKENAYKMAVNKSVEKTAKDAIAKQGKSPEAVKEANERMQQAAEIELQEIKDEAKERGEDEESIDESEDAANESLRGE